MQKKLTKILIQDLVPQAEFTVILFFLMREGGQRKAIERASNVLVPEQEPLLPGSTGGTNCMSCSFRNNVARGIAQPYQGLIKRNSTAIDTGCAMPLMQGSVL